MKLEIPKIFKPEDLNINMYDPKMNLAGVWAAESQRIFSEWLEQNWKVVYGHEEWGKYGWCSGSTIHKDENGKDMDYTHVAYLIAPTEIKKEGCEHKRIVVPRGSFTEAFEIGIHCYHCHKKLTPIWQEAE